MAQGWKPLPRTPTHRSMQQTSDPTGASTASQRPPAHFIAGSMLSGKTKMMVKKTTIAIPPRSAAAAAATQHWSQGATHKGCADRAVQKLGRQGARFAQVACQRKVPVGAHTRGRQA